MGGSNCVSLPIHRDRGHGRAVCRRRHLRSQLGKHVTQSGFYDEGSSSVKASLLADGAYGRDTSGHIIAIYTAPDGKTVDDPDFQKKILDNLAQVERDHPRRDPAVDRLLQEPAAAVQYGRREQEARVHVDPAQGQ